MKNNILQFTTPELVENRNGVPMTSSKTVAEVFGKDHGKVLRAIRNLECSEEFNQANFGFVQYADAKGEMRPAYAMTRDGFSYLVMGFTGKKAAQWKERFIEAFNIMEAKLKENNLVDLEKLFTDPNTIMTICQNWKVDREKLEVAESKIEQDKPKVLFAESVEVSEDSILVREMAKTIKQATGYDIGGQRFFFWLRENGYLIKAPGDDYNMPTQRSMNMKLFEIKKGTYQHPEEGPKLTKTPKVTGKGQVYFINKFKQIVALAV